VSVRYDPYCMINNFGSFGVSIASLSHDARDNLVSVQVYSSSKSPFYKRSFEKNERHTHNFDPLQMLSRASDADVKFLVSTHLACLISHVSFRHEQYMNNTLTSYFSLAKNSNQVRSHAVYKLCSSSRVSCSLG
jgi:hypothetical protein